MKKSIHDELIRMINENTSSDENPVDLLIDIIPMSKEAAYRRLRGEIKFTLDEAIRITQKLKISLKNLFELYADSNRVSFHLYDLEALGVRNIQPYYNMMKEMETSFSFITSGYSGQMYVASTYIPEGLSFRYKMITKFNLFKWIFQRNKNIPAPKLFDIKVPQEVEACQLGFSKLMNEFECVFIFVDDMFRPIIKDIKFFYNLGLVSNEELDELKAELNTFLDTLEGYVKTGKNEFGLPISVYVSEICFDASYIYIERSDGYQVFSINIYGINFLGTENRDITENQKKWIESLMRYSNYISKSGEHGRIQFFKTQRELLASL